MISFRSLSQSSLGLLETCPRKFQHIVLEGFDQPSNPQAQAAAQWGQQFHLLVQQQELGLDVTQVAASDPELLRCLADLTTYGAAQIDPNLGSIALRQTEQARCLDYRGYGLTVVYDLVLVGDRGAQLFDWKTYRQPPDRLTLANQWQTRLYLYVLAETTPHPPESLSLTYWFARFPEAAQTFRYDQAWHDRTRQALDDWIDRLEDWLGPTDQPGPDRTRPMQLPQVNSDLGRCSACAFAIRCGRSIGPSGQVLHHPAQVQALADRLSQQLQTPQEF